MLLRKDKEKLDFSVVSKGKKTLTFPALASLTLVACGGGGGGAMMQPSITANRATSTAGTNTITMD